MTTSLDVTIAINNGISVFAMLRCNETNEFRVIFDGFWGRATSCDAWPDSKVLLTKMKAYQWLNFNLEIEAKSFLRVLANRQSVVSIDQVELVAIFGDKHAVSQKVDKTAFEGVLAYSDATCINSSLKGLIGSSSQKVPLFVANVFYH